MMDELKVETVARYGVQELIDRYLEDCMTFEELCVAVAKLGYKTTSLYEMVIAQERGR